MFRCLARLCCDALDRADYLVTPVRLRVQDWIAGPLTGDRGATDVGRPPVLGTPRFSSCAARWARIWLPKWPQTRIYSAMSVWGVVKVRSWLGNSRIVQFHAIGTGILGRTLWRTLHLNPSF
jgi:hypothetical protein